MTNSKHDIRKHLGEYVSMAEKNRPQDELYWATFRPSPPMIPSEAQGLVVFKPSGKKLVILSWFGQTLSHGFLDPEHEPSALIGTTDDGQPVRVTSRYCADYDLVAAEAIQTYALRGSEVIIGKPKKTAYRATFRLINFFLDAVRIPRITPYCLRRYRPHLWFKAGGLTIIIRGIERKPKTDRDFDQSSELELSASRPMPSRELIDIGWKMIDLLSLASAQRVGYQDITFEGSSGSWILGYDRSIPPLRSIFRLIEAPFTRKALPRLLKKGLANVEKAQTKFGFFLVLRHFIEAQHASTVQDQLTSIFQGFEACISAFRASEKLMAVSEKEWNAACGWLSRVQIEHKPGRDARKALDRMKQQVRNEPSAKEILRQILTDLGLGSDLSFWRRRQDMFHRGDISRKGGLGKVVMDTLQASDLLARMLLRMVGYSGDMWRHHNRILEPGQVP